ncbi:uncharacterized protein CEXT_390971 [Caerostris extrusa]|uniref:Uncharacterized protein n=1 Tax=Caerostris extrusa TaxID=172846 RepID=A0AAV4XW15_CAEEX|nr:uncharacterized protein CEXT_390971 [Caerostris extrusa]
MIVEKYHRILAFRQRSWLAHFNNEKRKEAKDDFTRAFCKKMNNSFFGRLMLNQRKKKFSVRASPTEKDCQNNLSSPLLEYFEPINETLTNLKCENLN